MTILLNMTIELKHLGELRGGKGRSTDVCVHRNLFTDHLFCRCPARTVTSPIGHCGSDSPDSLRRGSVPKVEDTPTFPQFDCFV